MKRIYYSFLPETYSRPGGIWWHRDVTDHEAVDWIEALAPMAEHIRVSDTFPVHDAMSISPPVDSRIIK
jgi:hypothetical protein